jgi:hypothetical protein
VGVSGPVPKTMEERLAYARGLTRTTGVVHDIQLYQLKRYPYAVDPLLKPKGVEVRLDSERHHLEYRWKTLPADRAARARINRSAARRKRYQEGVAAACGWVQALLGDEWSVEVSLDGQGIYQVEGKEQDVEQPRTGGASPAKARDRSAS